MLQEDESSFSFFDPIAPGQVLKAISRGLRGTGQVSWRFKLRFYLKEVYSTQAQDEQASKSFTSWDSLGNAHSECFYLSMQKPNHGPRK